MATLSKSEQRTESARKGQREAMKGRHCPSCGRGNALGQAVVDEMGRVRRCRYCGHECGVIYGEVFGYG